MESRPQNPEFRNNPEPFTHVFTHCNSMHVQENCTYSREIPLCLDFSYHKEVIFFHITRDCS